MKVVILTFGVLLAVTATSVRAQEHDHSRMHHPQMPAREPPPESAPHVHAPVATAPGENESEHVPPDPPAQSLHDMSPAEMVRMMAMDDRSRTGKVMLDHVEWRARDGNDALAWDAHAWYGNDYDKLWLKTEGEHVAGRVEAARTEVLWDRIVTRWWSVQAGLRNDVGTGETGAPARTWLAMGVQGLAPQFFELEATAYIGDEGRSALRIKAEREILLTQRLVLQPEIEVAAFGKTDAAREIGAGLSEGVISLRLRYEFRPEVAPFLGAHWALRFGKTAELIRAGGDRANELQWVAGVRVWF